MIVSHPYRLLAVIAAALAMVVAGCSSSDSTGAGGDGGSDAVSVYPSPGTEVASPGSQISMVGIDPDDIGEITVVGSESGEHAGSVEAYEGLEGGSFVPEQAFEQGETVTVTTDLEVNGAEGGEFSFQIGNFRTQAAPPPKDIPKEGTLPQEPVDYKSRPDLRPPKVNVLTPASDEVAEGLIFIGPKWNGPIILDNEGELVYYAPGLPVADFKPQEYDGEQYLTWWQGPFNAGGYTEGRYMMANDSYEVEKIVESGNGYFGDLHEFTITDRGTAFVPAYRAVLMDLSDRGGPENAAVLDSVAQEIDIETGLVVWEWHSIGNVGLGESYSEVPETPEDAYDYFHINSIQEDYDGNIIVSARNTSTVYKIDKGTGEVIWRVGGNRPTFEQGKGLDLGYQHDAVPVEGEENVYSLYDNGAAPEITPYSRGLVFEVDEEAGTVKLTRKPYVHPDKLSAGSQGNMQMLPNGNVMIGWGSEPYMTEFSEDGEVLFDANYQARNSSYRTYRFPWTGDPVEEPAIATEQGQGGIRAWVSWNGSTEVDSWELLGGASEDELETVAEADRDGFETALTAQGDHAFYAARALDADGNELAQSPPVAAGEGWYPEFQRE